MRFAHRNHDLFWIWPALTSRWQCETYCQTPYANWPTISGSVLNITCSPEQVRTKKSSSMSVKSRWQTFDGPKILRSSPPALVYPIYPVAVAPHIHSEVDIALPLLRKFVKDTDTLHYTTKLNTIMKLNQTKTCEHVRSRNIFVILFGVFFSNFRSPAFLLLTRLILNMNNIH